MAEIGKGYARTDKVGVWHYRKKAAADMYILPNSAHPKKLKQGILEGDFLRFVTL